MTKYRKKPVVIECEQFTQAHVEANILDGQPLPRGVRRQSANFHKERRVVYGSRFSVRTIHGQDADIVAGDWIMPEPDGEHFYPCKPDIFAATYEAVASSGSPPSPDTQEQDVKQEREPDNSPDENGIVPWCEITVKISTANGDKDVQALVHPLCAGLAVTSNVFGKFDVTHLPTGKLIAKGYARMWGAVLVAAEFALCADWTQDATALAAELERTKDEPCGNPEAKSISLGVERQMTKGEVIQMLRSEIPKLDEFPWEDESPANRSYKLLKILAEKSK